MKWTSCKRAGTQAVLTGAKGEKHVTLVLKTAPRWAIDHLKMTEPITTPQGQVTHTQDLTATYDAGKGGLAPKSNRGPGLRQRGGEPRAVDALQS